MAEFNCLIAQEVVFCGQDVNQLACFAKKKEGRTVAVFFPYLMDKSFFPCTSRHLPALCLSVSKIPPLPGLGPVILSIIYLVT